MSRGNSHHQLRGTKSSLSVLGSYACGMPLAALCLERKLRTRCPAIKHLCFKVRILYSQRKVILLFGLRV